MVIRNWRDANPLVGHDSKVIWRLLSGAGQDNVNQPEAACLLRLKSLSRHTVQGGMKSDYHDHENEEQIYYFTRGSGKMLIDDKEYPIKAGDAVHLPPKTMHQLINDSEDEIEHILICAIVAP